MITLQRLVELRGDNALQARLTVLCEHVTVLMASRAEVERLKAMHRAGQVVPFDADLLATSEALMMAVYELGRHDGRAEISK